MTLKNQPILWRHACLFDNIGQNETATPKNCQFLWRRVMTRGQITLEMVIMSVAGQDVIYAISLAQKPRYFVPMTTEKQIKGTESL